MVSTKIGMKIILIKNPALYTYIYEYKTLHPTCGLTSGTAGVSKIKI